MKIMLIFLLLTHFNPSLHAEENNCEHLKMAQLLDDLRNYDELHNCSINITRDLGKSDEFPANDDQVYFKYKIQVIDKFFCELNPNHCTTELFEIKIKSQCPKVDIPNNREIHYEKLFTTDNGPVIRFIRAQFNVAGNLMLFSLGEKYKMHNSLDHRIVCKPRMFGGYQ